MMPWKCKPWFPDSSLRRPDTSVNTSTRGWLMPPFRLMNWPSGSEQSLHLVSRRGAGSDRAGRYPPAAYRRCPARSSKRRSAHPRATMNSWKQSPTPSTNARKNCANGAERIQSAAFRQTSITPSRNSHRARVPVANLPNQRSRAGRQDLPVAFTGFAGCLPPIIRERNRFDPWMRLPAPKSCELSRRPMRFSRQPIHNTFLPPPD